MRDRRRVAALLHRRALLDRLAGARDRRHPVLAQGQANVTEGRTAKHKDLANAGVVIAIITVVLSVLATITWILIFALVDWDEIDDSDDDPFDDSFEIRAVVRIVVQPSGFSAEALAIVAAAMAEDPYIKQYLMAAGPTPIPPRGVAGPGRADPLPPRARVRGALRARASSGSRPSSRPRTTCSRSPPRAPAEWSRPSRTSSARATKVLVASCGKFGERWAELAEAYGADLVHRDAGWGNASSPASSTRSSPRTRASRSSTRRSQRPPRASSTTSRRSPRSCTPHGALIGVDAVSGLGAVPLPPGRLGCRRGRRRLAEGAHVPARARLRRAQPGRARARRRARRPAATTSTGTRR